MVFVVIVTAGVVGVAPAAVVVVVAADVDAATVVVVAAADEFAVGAVVGSVESVEVTLATTVAVVAFAKTNEVFNSVVCVNSFKIGTRY